MSGLHAGPPAQGLYDPRFEHDACGVAFVATLTGEASHDIVARALTALRNLEHRGAAGAEVNSGDGAGILLQVPHAFLAEVVDFDVPDPGSYAVGTAFLEGDEDRVAKTRQRVEELADEEGLIVLGWRDVPVVPDLLGATARGVMPLFSQLFVAASGARLTGMALERRAFCLRKRAEREAEVYFGSLSTRTLLYKGMLTTDQLDHFFPDLTDERVTSALAVVHSRFSTNTFPSWPLAHPFRYIAHNGEINTVMGNRNWMRAREALLDSDLIPGDLDRLFPICTPGASDSASFDEVLELLHMGGRSLPHAVLMMIPEAWENHQEMDAERKAFYEFHASLMEPWDGPACVVFTDGSQIGAVLDRNGLRPSRYWVTDDGLVVLASEVGVLDLDPATIVRKGRLQPGRMFLVDTDEHRIIEDEEIKGELAAEHPYDEWLHAGLIHLDDIPEREHIVHTHSSVTRRQQVFGYTQEELRVLLTPMANSGVEALGSMGTDTPVAALSDKPRLLFDYFAQLFAQVTNPPLDAIREELVTSLGGTIGPEANLLDPTPAACRQIVLPFPVFDNDDLAKIRHINRDGDMPGFITHVSRGLYEVEGGGDAMARRLDEICAEVSAAIAGGARVIVLSDRHCTAELAPIPSLLLTGAVHHHLVREKTRTQVGLIVEAGDVREVHHVALLIGYGAAAVNPYLAMESVEDLARDGYYVTVEPEVAVKNLIKGLGKGVLKVMSKMGISTVASYTGAQTFEAIGLSQELVDKYFTGTTSKLGGIELDTLAEEVARRHAAAYPRGGISPTHRELAVGGEYQWRRPDLGAEPHLFDPETVFRLQHSTRNGRYDVFKQYTARVDEQSERLMTLRGLFRFKDAAEAGRAPVPIDEVEPVSAIVKRFSTGAMSYGSISREAHETLAIAMNRIGAKSNTGEGGEDTDRLHDPERRSSIKQVASGRFGVTSDYLTNADDIQIKMAQGAKPGEGGQLPGNKVYPWVALDSRCRADQPAAAPRHLLDRGSRPADPRPQERQPPSAGAREAGRRGRRRHGRGGGLQGPRRRGADLRARRWHRRGTDDVAQARRRPVGARPGRDPADTAGQRVARPDRRPDRRPAQDRTRRRGRGPARGRGVRLRHGPAGGQRLHHDAGLPPRHVPGRRRHPEPRAASALQRQAGVRGHVLRVHRRGGPRAPRRARLSQPRRGDRPGAGTRRGSRGRPLEGLGARPDADPARRRGGGPVRRPGPAADPDPGPRARPGPRQRADRPGGAGARAR
jgi:glutamate synthase (NADPH) large chain